jgi:hypothetical protein
MFAECYDRTMTAIVFTDLELIGADCTLCINIVDNVQRVESLR